MTVDISQLLLVFGFCWMVVACLLGISQGIKHTPHLNDLELMARAGDLLGYHRALSVFKQNTTAHTHSVLFPLVTMVIALSMPLTGYTGVYSAILGMGLIAATVIWTLGGIFHMKALKGLGDLLLLASILMTLVGLAKSL